MLMADELYDLLAISPAVTYICDPESNYPATFVSENIRQQLGYEPEEFVRDADFWVNRIHPDDVSRVLEELSSSVNKEKHSLEYRFLHKDGGYRWMYDEFKIRRDTEGNPEKVIGFWIDISDRKQAEQDASAAQSQLVEAIEALSEGFVFFDAQDRFVACNKRFRDLYAPVSDILVPCLRFEDWARALAKSGQVLDAIGREEEWLEQRMRDHRNRASPREIQLADGRHIRVMEYRTVSGGTAGLRIDVTENKRARIALGDSEERFRSLVEGSIQGILVSRRFKALFVNQAMADIFRFDSQAELLELNSILPHIAPEDRERVIGYAEARLRSEPSPSVYEARGIRNDGERIWLEVRASLINWVDGPAALATFVDISDRKRAELRVRESEERFRDFAEIGVDWLWETDSEHNLTYLSAGYEKTVGWDPGTLLGETRLELSRNVFNDPEHRAAHERDLKEQRSFEDFKLCHQAKDGSLRTLSISGRPLYDSDGLFSSYRGVARDITRVVEAEKAALDAALIAERASATKSRFLATASHDLRQPLQSLNLLNDALRKTVDSADAQKMLAMQKDALAGMRNLLNSLLDITRLESGSVAPKMTDVPLQQIFNTISAEFGEQARAKRLDLQIERTGATAYTDPILVTQALQNLVANAIRYTGKGIVRLDCSREAGGLKIAVTDSGIGVPKDQLTNIFAEFHQIERDPQARHGGLGLGLAIVQRIDEMLDIRIDVESEVGKGLTFSFMLPVGTAIPAESAPRAEFVEPSIPGTGIVLLIDDEVAVLEASQLLLEVEGYEVVAAASASAAHARLEELGNAPDIIVTDFHLMDDKSGIDIVQAVRKRANKQIPAVLVTGDTSPSVSALDIANLEILVKPIEPDQLLSAIQELLKKEVAVLS